MKPRQLGAAVLAVLLVASTATVAAAAVIDSPTRQNYDESTVPNPHVDVDVTKDVHKVGWDPVAYENNSGATVQADAEVNASNPNPHTLIASDINASAFGEFPRKSAENGENEASALDASEWSSTTSDSTNVSPAVSDTTTAPGVDAVQVKTSGGMGSGDTATFTYSNFSIDSDISKRYVQIIGDVNTLDSAATVMFRFKDSDGDYVEIDADTALTESNSTVFANATGEGDVVQEQVGQLTVQGSGDGSMSSITKLTVVFRDGDASVDLSALNAEKLSEWTLGTERVDSDGDGKMDTSQAIKEPHGSYSVESLSSSSFSSALSDARLMSVTSDLRFGARNLEDDMDARANITAAENYPSYEYKADLYYRLQLPDAYDLSYSNAELEAKVELPDSRYKTVRTSEGVSDLDFGNVSTWTDHTSSFTGQGSVVVLDGTITPGEEIAVNFEEVVTEDEKSNMFTAGGGGGQFDRSNNGGGLLGKIVGALGVIFGGSWLFSKGSKGS